MEPEGDVVRWWETGEVCADTEYRLGVIDLVSRASSLAPLALDAVLERKRGIDNLSRNDVCGEGVIATEVDENEACARALARNDVQLMIASKDD